MANIAKLEFPALNISGENYMTWTANVKRHLKAMGVIEVINEENDCSNQEKAKADVFIHKHIDNLLQHEYFNSDDPYELWTDLKNRFDNQKEVLLPTAKNEWNSLRFQDFTKVNDYTSALFKVCSKLEFCGHPVTEEEKLEKTYSTFHASHFNLAQQYRLLKFYRYSDLNAHLLVAEQHNMLLMKNHEARPTGSLTIPEANVVNDYQNKREQGRGQGQGQGRGKGQGRGRGRGRGYFGKGHYNGHNHTFKNNKYYRGRGRGRGRGRNQRTTNYHAPQDNTSNFHNQRNETGVSGKIDNSCYRCGSVDHWVKTCRTAPHLCELYKASLKGKEKEVNYLDKFNVQLNATDFNEDI